MNMPSSHDAWKTTPPDDFAPGEEDMLSLLDDIKRLLRLDGFDLLAVSAELVVPDESDASMYVEVCFGGDDVTDVESFAEFQSELCDRLRKLLVAVAEAE